MDADRYPDRWWHIPAAILVLLACALMPADPEPEPTDNQYWAETHYERDYALRVQDTNDQMLREQYGARDHP